MLHVNVGHVPTQLQILERKTSTILLQHFYSIYINKDFNKVNFQIKNISFRLKYNVLNFPLFIIIPTFSHRNIFTRKTKKHISYGESFIKLMDGANKEKKIDFDRSKIIESPLWKV